MAERTWPTRPSMRWTWRPAPWSLSPCRTPTRAIPRRSSKQPLPQRSKSNTQAAVQTPQALAEIIADKGYHSNQIMIELEAVGLRSYVAEPDRGRRDWSKEPAAQTLVDR